jgi:hypothetical protein
MAAYRRHKRRGEAVDKACQNAMRETSRNQSGRADDEQQSAPVVAIHGAFVAAAPGAAVDARERLIANLRLVERAMEAIVEATPERIIPLSTRHSELVTQLLAVGGGGTDGEPAEEANPIAKLVASRSAPGRTAAAPRK